MSKTPILIQMLKLPYSRLAYFAVATILVQLGMSNPIPDPLPDPDGKPADMTKKIKVFVLMGEINMMGSGSMGPDNKPGTLANLTKQQNKYPFLVDSSGNWTERKDVFFYNADKKRGSLLSAKSNDGSNIGPELGFGFIMGEYFDEPVYLIKSCVGNRSLGWDMLPPGSEQFTFEGKTYAGYKDSPASWVPGESKQSVNWYGGKQYDADLGAAMSALFNIDKLYPGYKQNQYEVVGFAFWQGFKDQKDKALISRYETNLANLIKALRKDYFAPNAKFVCATVGFNGDKMNADFKQIAEAQLAVSDPGKHPEFKGNVRTIDSRPFWREKDVSPGGDALRYNRNAEVPMEVGLAMGRAMVEMLEGN